MLTLCPRGTSYNVPVHAQYSLIHIVLLNIHLRWGVDKYRALQSREIKSIRHAFYYEILCFTSVL